MTTLPAVPARAGTSAPLRPAGPPALLCAVLLALAVAGAPVAAEGGGHRIYLSAGAPWGEPGARETFNAACHDTAWRDTLYLSFEPASDDSAFVTASGEIYVYAQPGDTLGSFWEMERGGRNNGGLVMEFGPDASFPQPQPWPVPGLAVVRYDRTPQSGRFRFVFAVPITQPGPVKAGTRYVVGRLLLGPRHPGLEGCDRPVCIEWRTASLGFKGRPMEHSKLGEGRWLGRGGADLRCRGRIPGWRPKAAGSGPVSPPPAER